MPTLHDLLESVEPGLMTASGNLQLIPLRRKEQRSPSLEYMLAGEAFDRGVLRVTEAVGGGRVPKLCAVNEADLPILFLDGEELIGAKQNRILNTDVLMKPRSEKTIPVSCVEERRWRHTRPDFEVGGYTPPPIRAKKSSSVSRSLQETDMADSDQGEVWEEVDSMLTCMGTSSDTLAMSDAFDQRKEDLDSFVTDLSCPDDAVGVIVMVNGKFAALDLFDRPSTLRQVWSRLVSGYAADAIMKRELPGSNAPTVDATKLLDRLGRTECVAFSGVDMGDDWRFDSSGTVGSALVAQDTALHLSAFPG